MNNIASTKPYILRAIYEWCSDNGFTPYLSVWVNADTKVPLQYVNNNEIVLNISANSCKNLQIDNNFVSFSARFSGVVHNIFLPIANIMAIYSKENGIGMGFNSQEYDLVPSEHNFVESDDTSSQHPSLDEDENSYGGFAQLSKKGNERPTFADDENPMGFNQISSTDDKKPMGFNQIQSNERECKPHFVDLTKGDDPEDPNDLPPTAGKPPELRIVK